MKVALYYPWVYLTSGAERTILELTGRSRHQWTIFTNRFEPGSTFAGFRQRRLVELPEVSVRRSMGPVATAASKILLQRLPTEDFDALLVVSEGLGDLVVFRNAKKPTLCLCLTPLRIAFDEYYRNRYLSDKGVLGRLVLEAGCSFFRWIDRLAWRRYHRVFCISEEAKRRAVAGRLAPSDQLEILHVGIGLAPSEPSDRFERFFLLPGRIMWTKNIELGIEAFMRFRDRGAFEDWRLAIAGIVDEKSRDYLVRLEQLAARDPGIRVHISPSDGELADLYQRCYTVLFTAFNEDWGIVPIESMAFGKPVIATDQGGPRESVQHDEQGFLVTPNPEAFAERMAELARDQGLARRLGSAGPRRAAEFSWDAFTQRLDDALEEAVHSPGHNPTVVRPEERTPIIEDRV